MKYFLIGLLIMVAGCNNSNVDIASSQATAGSVPSVELTAQEIAKLEAAIRARKPLPMSGITEDPQIDDFEILEPGGSLRMMPLPAKKKFVIAAGIAGDIVEASYTLTDLSGKKIIQSQLVESKLPYRFLGTITIPSETFRLQITAKSTNGKVATKSIPFQFETLGTSIHISPDSALIIPGKPMGVTVTLESQSVSDTFNITLNLPSGFTSNVNNFTTKLTAGQSSKFKAKITAPAGIPSYSEVTLRATAKAQNSLKEQFSEVSFRVK